MPFTGVTDHMLLPPVMTWRVSAMPFWPAHGENDESGDREGHDADQTHQTVVRI